MEKIKIHMKSGRSMIVEAEARVGTDTLGSGEPVVDCDDLVCYWPGKGYRVISPSLYDYKDAQQVMIETWRTYAL